MEKRRVTVLIGGRPYSFYSDDSDEYVSLLEQEANGYMNQTAAFSSSSGYTNAVLSVILLTDQLLRMKTEQQMRQIAQQIAQPNVRKKSQAKSGSNGDNQVSVWDLLDGGGSQSPQSP